MLADRVAALRRNSVKGLVTAYLEISTVVTHLQSRTALTARQLKLLI
jgi:hypothetical protein